MTNIDEDSNLKYHLTTSVKGRVKIGFSQCYFSKYFSEFRHEKTKTKHILYRLF
jgi:hypothetical protein